MAFKTLDELISYNRSSFQAKTLAVAAAHDDHCLDAVIKARDEGIIKPLLIGKADEIKHILDTMGTSVGSDQIIDEPDVDAAAVKAVQSVREGRADFLMKGILNTSNMLRPIVNKEYGLTDQDSTGVISLLGITEIPGYEKLLATTDAGICIAPDLEQKKGIIINAVRALTSLGISNPKVAVMAAVETPNPKMPESMDAVALAEMNRNGEIRDCIVEGPISMDIALSAEAARIKGYQGQIVGDPDVLLWPNVVAGNMFVKGLVRFIPGLKTISVAVGAKVPLVITSRAAAVESKYRAISVAAFMLNK